MKAKKDAEEGEDNMSALELSSSDNKTNGGVFVPPVPTGNSIFDREQSRSKECVFCCCWRDFPLYLTTKFGTKFVPKY